MAYKITRYQLIHRSIIFHSNLSQRRRVNKKENTKQYVFFLVVHGIKIVILISFQMLGISFSEFKTFLGLFYTVLFASRIFYVYY